MLAHPPHSFLSFWACYISLLVWRFQNCSVILIVCWYAFIYKIVNQYLEFGRRPVRFAVLFQWSRGAWSGRGLGQVSSPGPGDGATQVWHPGVGKPASEVGAASCFIISRHDAFFFILCFYIWLIWGGLFAQQGDNIQSSFAEWFTALWWRMIGGIDTAHSWGFVFDDGVIDWIIGSSGVHQVMVWVLW